MMNDDYTLSNLGSEVIIHLIGNIGGYGYGNGIGGYRYCNGIGGYGYGNCIGGYGYGSEVILHLIGNIGGYGYSNGIGGYGYGSEVIIHLIGKIRGYGYGNGIGINRYDIISANRIGGYGYCNDISINRDDIISTNHIGGYGNVHWISKAGGSKNGNEARSVCCDLMGRDIDTRNDNILCIYRLNKIISSEFELLDVKVPGLGYPMKVNNSALSAFPIYGSDASF